MPGRGAESRPRKGQEVTVRLRAALEDGSVVEEDPGLTFTLGDCDVLQVGLGEGSPGGGGNLGAQEQLCCCKHLSAMFFPPPGSGSLRAAAGVGRKCFNRVGCQVLLRLARQVSGEGAKQGREAPKSAVTPPPRDSPRSWGSDFPSGQQAGRAERVFVPFPHAGARTSHPTPP